jgi:hypothetical protein
MPLPYKRKMDTVQPRRSEPEGLDEYSTRSKIIPKHCVVNMPLELGQGLTETLEKKSNSLCYHRLPDIISRKDMMKKRKS